MFERSSILVRLWVVYSSRGNLRARGSRRAARTPRVARRSRGATPVAGTRPRASRSPSTGRGGTRADDGEGDDRRPDDGSGSSASRRRWYPRDNGRSHMSAFGAPLREACAASGGGAPRVVSECIAWLDAHGASARAPPARTAAPPALISRAHRPRPRSFRFVPPPRSELPGRRPRRPALPSRAPLPGKPTPRRARSHPHPHPHPRALASQSPPRPPTAAPPTAAPAPPRASSAASPRDPPSPPSPPSTRATTPSRSAA